MGLPSSRRGRGVAALPLFVGLIAPLIASCSASSDTSSPWSYEPFTELISSAIDDATAGGASDQQMALLTSAQVEGEMPIDLMKSAVYNAIDCFNSVGGQATYEETTEPSGLVQPGYKALFATTLPDTLHDSCETKELRWVSFVYSLQPSSRELVGQFVMSKEDVLRQCMEDAGIKTDPKATGWDLAQQASELPGDTAGGMDCLAAADIWSL